MAGTIRAVHYLNQFFAGLGGEEAAAAPPRWFDGIRGPGQLVAQLAPELGSTKRPPKRARRVCPRRNAATSKPTSAARR